MMYVHCCHQCRKIYTLNGHKQSCPKCGHTLKELKVSYVEFLESSPEKRIQLAEFQKLP